MKRPARAGHADGSTVMPGDGSVKRADVMVDVSYNKPAAII